MTTLYIAETCRVAESFRDASLCMDILACFCPIVTPVDSRLITFSGYWKWAASGRSKHVHPVSRRRC
jgi:hypothetical protein